MSRIRMRFQTRLEGTSSSSSSEAVSLAFRLVDRNYILTTTTLSSDYRLPLRTRSFNHYERDTFANMS